jgi:hypothetical protein
MIKLINYFAPKNFLMGRYGIALRSADLWLSIRLIKDRFSHIEGVNVSSSPLLLSGGGLMGR